MSTYLTRHRSDHGPRWAVDGHTLSSDTSLSTLLENPADAMASMLAAARSPTAADGKLLAPIDDGQEVWAAGVTYLRSREAWVEESQSKDLYQKVYEAERVEVFFKANGWLTRELAIPHGALLMTSTGIVPADVFTLVVGDTVRIEVGELALENIVQS